MLHIKHEDKILSALPIIRKKNNSQNCYINYFEISEKSSFDNITQHFLIQYFLKEKTDMLNQLDISFTFIRTTYFLNKPRIQYLILY